MENSSWTDEDLAGEYTLANGQRGIRARRHIPAGKIIGIYGGEIRQYKIHDGIIADPDAAAEVIQIAREDDIVFGLVTPPGARFYGIDYLNHSCTPNVLVVGQIVVMTARDIAPGEPLTADYRRWDLVPYGENCWCPQPRCVI